MGKEGIIIRLDASYMPYRVEFEDNIQDINIWWFKENELEFTKKYETKLYKVLNNV